MIKTANFKYAFGLLMLAILALLSPASHAAYGTNITDMVSDATSLFSSVQTLVILITGFGIALWVINKIRRR